MIYRETDTGRYVYILAEPAYPRRECQVFQQELDNVGNFIGTAFPSKGNRLGLAAAYWRASGIRPKNLDELEYMLTNPRIEYTIREGEVVIRNRG